MTPYSLTGSQFGKSIQSIRRSTPAPSSPLTSKAQSFLNVCAPLAYEEAIRQASLLKVTVEVWSCRETSDDLIVRTTFSTLTPEKHYKGRMTLPRWQESPFFLLKIQEHSLITESFLSSLIRAYPSYGLSRNRLYTFPVLTSQEIILADLSPTLGTSCAI